MRASMRLRWQFAAQSWTKQRVNDIPSGRPDQAGPMATGMVLALSGQLRLDGPWIAHRARLARSEQG